MKIKSHLHAINPYENFPIENFEKKVEGWGGTKDIFGKLIKKYKPELIIEVGSWLGQSALNMAKSCKDNKLDAEIVCVDTWLGSLEFWDGSDGIRHEQLKLINGYPSVYYQFLANIIHNEHEDIITPFPVTSSVAAQWFKYKKIKADLIYIDASHTYEDVLSDLWSYYQLLNEDGIIFGHDLDWKSVEYAVEDFCKANDLNLSSEEEFWIIKGVN